MSMNVNTPGAPVTTRTEGTDQAQSPQPAAGGTLGGHTVQAADNHRAPPAQTSIGDKVKAFFSAIGGGISNAAGNAARSVGNAFSSVARAYNDAAAARAETRFQRTSDRLAANVMDPQRSTYDKGNALAQLITRSDNRENGHGVERAVERIFGTIQQLPAPQRQAAIDSLRGFNDPGGMRTDLLQGKADQQNDVRNAMAQATPGGEAPAPLTAADFVPTMFGDVMLMVGNEAQGHLDRIDRQAEVDAVTSMDLDANPLVSGNATPGLRAILTAYTASRYIEENMNFLNEVNDLNDQMNAAGGVDAQAVTAFNALYDEYIGQGSNQEVNISSSQRNPLDAVRQDPTLLTPQTLSEAYEEIAKVVVINVALGSGGIAQFAPLQAYIETGALPQ